MMEIPQLKWLWSYLDHWVKLMPHEVAYHHDGSSCTYGELEKQVNNMARTFRTIGLQAGDRIVTILPSRPEYLVTYLAASQLGIITTPFDVRYKSGDLKRFINQVQPRLILSMSESKENGIWQQLQALDKTLQWSIHYYFIGPSEFGKSYTDLVRGSGILDTSIADIRTKLNENDGSLIVFTGGTTGKPKAALLSHKNIVSMCFYEEAFLRRELRRAGFEKRISSLAALPPSHVGGSVEFIFMGLVGGFELYFLDHWSPTKVLEMTSQYQIPWMGAVPTMYHILLSLPELSAYDLTNLYLVLLSGERVTQELIQDIQQQICKRIANGYGSTEAGPELTFTLPEDSPEQLANGYVGHPLPTVELKIIDSLGNSLKRGEVGEVLAKSDFTIHEYFQMPEENRLGFTVDGFCLTGDLGYLDQTGGLHLQGRKKHVIRVGGYTVMPTEVEEVALQINGIDMAAALGAPDPIYSEVVWLFVVLQADTALSEADIHDYIKSRLANYKVPKRILIRSNIPTTRIGKSDRRALQKEMELEEWMV